MRIEADGAAGLLHVPNAAWPCAIGRAGVVDGARKREGDGASPRGEWPIRGVLLRPDRVPSLRLHVPWRWLRPDDGWSDDPRDPAYNRPVRHPHPFGAERLWRDDALYDAIVVLGHNDDPPIPGHGSAIFLHVAPDSGTTEGCIAIARARLLALLPIVRPGDTLAIT
jgi:L,D-peptidoglycan transpeptidase YkuD (ErfK/YbiS/YcfS/YnhG family)